MVPHVAHVAPHVPPHVAHVPPHSCGCWQDLVLYQLLN